MNKQFIISGLQIEKGQWNTDFDMFSRRDENGKVFGTDKARKYSCRQELLHSGEDILIRRYREDNKYLSLTNILKSYGFLKPKKSKSEMNEIIRKFIDLRLFGFILNPNKEFSFSEKGPVQFQYANDINVDDTQEILNDIISYKTSKETNEDMTTIGKQNVIDSGFLNYTISVEPNAYKEILSNYTDLSDVEIEELYIEDLTKLHQSLNTDVTSLDSCAKSGVTNLYNIIITMKDELSSINKQLLGAVRVKKESNSNIKIDFTNTFHAIKEVKNNIESVQIVYSKAAEEASFLSIGSIVSDLEDLGINVNTKDLFE